MDNLFKVFLPANTKNKYPCGSARNKSAAIHFYRGAAININKLDFSTSLVKECIKVCWLCILSKKKILFSPDNFRPKKESPVKYDRKKHQVYRIKEFRKLKKHKNYKENYVAYYVFPRLEDINT